jgi:hypothetical protein
MHVVASSSSCCSGLGALVGLSSVLGASRKPLRISDLLKSSGSCGSGLGARGRREPFSPASLQPAKSHACGCVVKLLLQRSRRASRPRPSLRLRSNPLEEPCMWLRRQAPVAAGSARVDGASPSLRLRSNPLEEPCMWLRRQAPVAAVSVR